MKTKQLFSKSLCTALFAGALFLGSTAVFAQVKIGTNPTTINAANNLEVESSTAGNKVSIDKTTGKVTIADGTQGAGKLLTSDVNGGASWQTAAAIRVPETVFIGQQSGNYTITNFSGTYNEVKDRIPLVPRAGSLPGYDATTKLYTIQESGYYRINIGMGAVGTLAYAAGQNNLVRLYLNPANVLVEFAPFHSATAPILTTYWEGYYAAGTTFCPYVISATYSSTPENATVFNGFMSITKLF